LLRRGICGGTECREARTFKVLLPKKLHSTGFSKPFQGIRSIFPTSSALDLQITLPPTSRTSAAAAAAKVVRFVKQLFQPSKLFKK
jgi:hypothetical protein